MSAPGHQLLDLHCPCPHARPHCAALKRCSHTLPALPLLPALLVACRRPAVSGATVLLSSSPGHLPCTPRPSGCAPHPSLPTRHCWRCTPNLQPAATMERATPAAAVAIAQWTTCACQNICHRKGKGGGLAVTFPLADGWLGDLPPKHC